VKRPILGLLAAAMLSLGLLGSSPARAAVSHAPTAGMVTPAHDGDDHGHKYSHPDRQGGTRWHDHDGDDDDNGGRPRRCSGLIVVCLG
jgi:hypothetical protein